MLHGNMEERLTKYVHGKCFPNIDIHVQDPISMYIQAEPNADPGLLDLSECQKQLGVSGGGH